MDRAWTVLCLCILIASVAVLYDQLTKRIPSRLRSEEAPKSAFGLVRADKLSSLASAYGIDIIFVHGLGSNPDKTWGQKDGKCWVSNFLPDDLPPTNDTRLFFYNYDSYWKRDAVHTRLEHLGISLLEYINTGIHRPEKDQSRNLIFVGYSYGGLMIKQALIQASGSERLAHIAMHTKAVLFLGTPHRGSSFTTLGQLAAQALRPLGSNPSILAEVEYDSIPLLKLHMDFEGAIHDNLRVVNFFEQRPTLIMKIWFIQWQEFCVREQSATFGGRRVENIGLPVNHIGINKFGSKNESYQMILGKLVEIVRSLSQPTGYCYSVPLKTVHTYTQRQERTDALEEKLKVRRHQGADVLHAVAIHGLGGTGKSQLALKYAEDHKHRYDPVLWLDATSAETIRSSFERCATELKLFVDRSETNASSLVDSRALQAVLRWLRDRRETDDEWLVIVDNADDVTWGVKSVIPKGERGSIIITSRDNLSPMLIDGSCKQLEVSVMSPSEAKALLLRRLQWDVESAPEKIQQSCWGVVQRLGRLALAVDLVGAYISNEPNQEIALMQYVEDYDKHKDDLLQDGRFCGLLPTEKTVWTVWNTTFEKLERDHARFLPTILLAFLARFKGNIIQDEIFHLASLGMAEVNRGLREEEQRLPSDIRQFLELNGTGWDSFLYRKSRDVLVRYSLVQRVEGEWPGVTMHSLVKWRAMQYKKNKRWEWWHSIFVLAACHQLPQEHESPRFRRQLLVHVPEVAQAWLDRNKVEEKTKLFMQRTFSRVHHIRQEELFHIYKTLTDADGRGIAVLCGIGGVGKTQLAATYTECHRVDYSDIFWLDAKSEDSAKMSYTRIAKEIVLEHPSASQFGGITTDSKEDEIMTVVKQWLNHPRNTRWLMICDNYDNPVADDIHRFLPEANHGSVIIITRSSTVKIGCRIQVRNLDIPDSLEILSDTSLRKTALNDPAAAELAKELGGLPLPLAMAGAYISSVGISFADYLRLYKASWLRLQQTSPGVGSYIDRAPMLTLQLSFERIRQESELSAQLIQLWAYFDNQDLWLELLREGSSGGPDWLCQLTEDELSFKQVVRVLLNYGLVEVNKSRESIIESEGYGLHSYVHMWTVQVLNEKCKVEMAGLALDCVASHIPVGDSPNSWAIQRRLLRHAARCWSFVENGMVDDDGRARALHSLGYLYAQQGKYGDAEKMFERALQGEERALGPDHTSTLDTVNSLGLLYADLGRLQEAEMMYQRALQGYEKALEPDHPSILPAVNNLGLLYADLGRLDEAEMMYQRALQGYEKAFGPDHPSTLSAINNLGVLYADLGRLDEAAMMYQRALQGYEKALGPDHPSTLSAINNLGLLYADLGRLGEAETMYQRALQGYEKALEPDHPSTLSAVNNLGLLYADLGRLDEAETMYQRALQGYEKALGPNHPSTLSAVNNLGVLYADLGRLDEAETMYQRALQGYEKALGPNHPSTLSAVKNLGVLYADLGRLDEAETMYQRALHGYEKALGPDHPSTLTSIGNLASTYRDQGRPKEAEKLFVQVMETFKRVLGEEHPDTLTGMGNLALTYGNQGRWKEAEELQVKELEICLRVLGEEHPDTLTSIANLAHTWKSQNRNEEAILSMAKCFELQKRILGPYHPATETSLKTLSQWRMENL